ncbi:GNAT family N-acetyltransferase [Burkholderia dolosa]|uniref:acyl-homoserine-lactone synthase n=1 Tax=Burkholderia dolosa TaxID=152500 RepID=UPI001B926D53|nr:acyl-homoserine-lactone synthase [Burkholderia dolosa]MBR8313570.1 GNAT family N-acetyltransferase [Burkholderia dolosa]
MVPTIRIAPQRDWEMSDLVDMYRFRARVFSDRMGWEVNRFGGLEVDAYDGLSPHYMLIRDESEQVRGCWRLLPTEGPYMLKDTFPQLLHGQDAPQAPDVWELSRFALDSSGNESAFGFTDFAMEAIREIIAFGERRGLRQYVTVTTTAVERLLRRTGIEIHRFGPPIRVGKENAVALTVVLGEQTHTALFGEMLVAA